MLWRRIRDDEDIHGVEQTGAPFFTPRLLHNTIQPVENACIGYLPVLGDQLHGKRMGCSELHDEYACRDDDRRSSCIQNDPPVHSCLILVRSLYVYSDSQLFCLKISCLAKKNPGICRDFFALSGGCSTWPARNSLTMLVGLGSRWGGHTPVWFRGHGCHAKKAFFLVEGTSCLSIPSGFQDVP